MPSTKNLAVFPHLKLLLWSPSGKGKTTLLGGFEDITDRPGYVFDFDCRVHVLAGRNIEYDTYTDIDRKNPNAFHAAWDKLVWIVSEQNKKGGICPYGFVALDSFTLFQFAVMHLAIKETTPVMKPKRVTDGKIFEVPGQPDYQAYHYMIHEFLDKLTKQVNAHVIVTAHESRDEEEISKKVFFNFDAFGKTQNRLPGYFNEVWRMETEQGSTSGPNNTIISVTNHVVITRPDSLRSARSAYKDALPGKIVLPQDGSGMKVIYGKIVEWLKAKHPEAYKNAALDAMDKK